MTTSVEPQESKKSHTRKRLSSANAARLLMALAAMFGWPLAAPAATVALGGVSFNTLIPSGGGGAGVTDFELDNFTGAFALPAEFPVIAGVTFQDSQLVLTESGGAQDVVALGDLTPGANTPAALDFSSTFNFVSASFTATLSSSAFALSDGTTFEASSTQISSEVIPSSGMTLSPDLDFSLIVVSGSVVQTSVPEPRSVFLALFGLASALYRLRQSFNARPTRCQNAEAIADV